MPTRLRLVDAGFLDAESVTEPHHVATVAVLGPRPDDTGADSNGRRFGFDTLLQAIEDRIALVPRYRQRVRRVAGALAAPVWVDDDHFDLSFHVRRSALPRPGSAEQLRELVARLIARPLDRERPLWEAYLIEGLERGETALLIKSHQALVDGTDTVDLAQVLLEETARPRVIPAEDWRAEPGPSAVRLVAAGAWHSTARPFELASRIAGQVSAVLPGLPAVRPGRVTPSGPFACALSQQRRLVGVATRLEDYRAVRDQHGGTVNDVILATISGGLRSWLLTRGTQVSSSTSVRAMVPMSVHDDDAEPTSLGSQVRGQLLTIPVGEPDALMRLHQVSYALAAHRETGRAVAANKLAGLPGFAPTTFHAMGARVAQSSPNQAYSLVITNVPGPQDPLYIAGAPLRQTYPVLPLIGRRALAIGVTSYDGGVFYGVNADRDAVPDADVLAAGIREALEELLDAASTVHAAGPDRR